MKNAVVFQSPESMEVEIELPYKGKLRGMGIPKGITLVVGGGYHGKSTLLKALEQGIYQHIEGDGREYVVTADTAVKIRAEDGRAVSHVDISPFINNLPMVKIQQISLQKMPVLNFPGSKCCRSYTSRCRIAFN